MVANGCTDDTAARARRFADRGVTVVETPVGSKTGALNLGDEACTSFPRFYVDADIEVTIDALREVARLLERDELVIAAPRAVVDYRRRPWLVRGFYAVWTSLPYFTEGVIGAGIYAFSERGRRRFDRFPDIIADDEFARLQARPHERGNTERGTFTITPPTTLRDVLKIFTRSRVGGFRRARCLALPPVLEGRRRGLPLRPCAHRGRRARGRLRSRAARAHPLARALPRSHRARAVARIRRRSPEDRAPPPGVDLRLRGVLRAGGRAPAHREARDQGRPRVEPASLGVVLTRGSGRYPARPDSAEAYWSG